MCGEPIIEGGVLATRKSWHQMCATRWTIMNQPAQARRFVFKRDGGRCARCGIVTDDWEADHVIPLRHAWLPEHWSLANLETLCRPHHVAKTNADRKKYA
jgi:5-methylcytosine-specific restriction endonuclease McrA